MIQRSHLAALTFTLALSGVGTALAQLPPGFPGINQENLVSVSDLEHACSQDYLEGDTDCRLAIGIALGKEPIVERKPDVKGGYTLTRKLQEADPPRVGWLGEEACGHRKWESCMLYTMLLEKGDGIPQDPVRALAWTQIACKGGHFRACEDLKQRGIKPQANPLHLSRPEWVQPPTPGPPPIRINRPAEGASLPVPASPAPEASPPKPGEPIDPGNPLEEDLLSRCKAGSGGACFRLAAGYEHGEGLPEHPQQAMYYYDKACTLGVRPACARVGKTIPEGVDAALARRRTIGLAVLGAIVFGAFSGGVAILVFVLKRLSSTREPPRRPPVRPPVRPATR
jgi:hypothetical protein